MKWAPSSTSWTTILLIAGILTGCESESTSPPPTDFELVVQPIDRSLRLGLSLVWSLGDDLDDRVQLFRVRDAEQASGGRFYVLDAGNHRVLEISRSGEVTRQLGREGDGPGEFRSPSAMVIRNDTVMVSDGTGIVHFFGPNGESIRTHRLSFPDEEVNMMGTIAISPDGWMVSGFGLARSDPDLPNLMREHLFTVDPSTGDLRPTGLEWSPESEARSGGLPSPFHQFPAGGYDGHGRMLMAEVSTYRIDIYESSGALIKRVEGTVPPVEIDRQLIEKWKGSQICNREPIECDASRSKLELSLPDPEWRSVIGRVRPYASGHFSVLREDLDPDPLDDESPGEYDYFDPEGVFIGSTTGLTPLWFDGSRILSLERNNLGIESITLYDVG